MNLSLSCRRATSRDLQVIRLVGYSIRIIAGNQDLADCSSPKACLKQAFALHWIDHEEIWLDMLSARNRMSHTHNAADAFTVYDRLQEYRQQMGILLAALKAQD